MSQRVQTPSLLDLTLAAAVRDRQTTRSDGTGIERLIHGLKIKPLVQGEMELVLFDPRPDSPTCGEVQRIVLTEQSRCLVNVPRNVWHADHNIGSKDVVVVNHPTMAYDHANPDKYRLPIDTELIPYSFGDAKGW